MSLLAQISKGSKLSIPAYNKTPVPICGIVAFSWIYRRNKILILVVRCFVNRYPDPHFDKCVSSVMLRLKNISCWTQSRWGKCINLNHKRVL
jgi:hypothetical protein